MQTSILSEDAFVEIATDSLTADKVRLAIAHEIIDTALSDRPIIRNFVRGPASEIIAGILATSIVNDGIQLISRLTYEVLVHDNGQQVAINLEPIKGLITNIINVLSRDDTATINVDDIPNEIVLIDQGELPPLEDYIIAVDWITLLLGLLSVGLFVLVLWKSWSTPSRNSYLKWFGGMLALGAATLGLLTWTVGSTAVLTVNSATGRVIVSETYDNLVAQLRVQSFGLVVIGIGIWLIGWWMLRESAHRHAEATEVSVESVDVASAEPAQ